MWRVCKSSKIKHPGGSGDLSSGPPNGDPGPLPIFQEFLLNCQITPLYYMYVSIFLFCILAAYRETVGELVPFKEFGYSSLDQFLGSIPTHVSLQR